MPIDKFVLILISVVATAALTVWVGTLVMASLQIPAAGWLMFVPAMLVGYVVWRVIAERLGNREDDHYDSIEK